MTKSAICLVVDRLHSGFVGCYGNTWIHTPEIDRLAGESFLFDQAIIDTPQLDHLYRSLWTAIHSAIAVEENPAQHSSALPGIISAAQVKTTLISDEPHVAEHPLAMQFDERLLLELSGGEQAAASIETTRLAQFFAAAVEWLQGAKEPYLLWLHTRGLAWPWDAPLEFRNQYAEEDDPPPPEGTDPPCKMLPESFDPDELWGWSQAYAGQVSLLDTCLGALVEELRAKPKSSQPLFTLLSARGFPLGEHQRLGPVNDALYGELVQVPWLVRMPDQLGAASRSQAIVQPNDLMPTLLDWWGLEPPPARGGHSLLSIIQGETQRAGDYAVTVGQGESSIRTPAWHLRAADTATQPAELFAKPDDRFEVNEVSDRCPEIALALGEALRQFESAAKSGSIDSLPALNDATLNGVD